VAVPSTARDVFARSDVGIEGSNPTLDLDICSLFVFVLSFVGSSLEMV
jgi:hypothetical protein